jgi:hypothetical protein
VGSRASSGCSASHCGAGSTATHAGAGDAVSLHASALNSFSDRRLKKGIQDSGLGLDFIEKLRPVSYYFKAGKPQLNYGFIAQDVEQALGGTGTSMVTRDNDAMGTYELNYSEIISALVKAVQQQQEITALKKDIADLKAAHAPNPNRLTN